VRTKEVCRGAELAVVDADALLLLAATAFLRFFCLAGAGEAGVTASPGMAEKSRNESATTHDVVPQRARNVIPKALGRAP